MSHIIDEIDVDVFLQDNYAEYGRAVNFERAIPGVDGLKPIHRRILMALRDSANGKTIPTLNAIGHIQTLHPFGSQSLESTVADMVRFGVLEGEGAFGNKLMENIPPAAPRYTRVGLTNESSEYYFKLVDYAKEIEGEVFMEPESLICPVPYCLIYGSLNWGFGILGRTPAFTYQSLLDAYFSNDPSKLKPQFGYELNEKESTLQRLWDTGRGRVSLSMNCVRINNNEILISGSGETFKPAIGLLQEYVDAGQIIVQTESTDQITFRVYRAYRSRVDMDEVFRICQQAVQHSRKYHIIAVINDTIRTIGIREWIEITMTRYLESYAQFVGDRVEKLEFEIKVLEALPDVAKLIFDNKTDEEILAELDYLTEDVLSKIKAKTIGTLRRESWEGDIEKLNNRIKAIKSENIKEEIHSYYK